MVHNTRRASQDRSSGITIFQENICNYSACEGVKTFALQQIKKATHACNHLTDPSEPDALHDFRVALRRLRTWMRANKHHHNVKGKTIKKLGLLTDSTNRCRDLEVCKNYFNKYVSEEEHLFTDNSKELEILLGNMSRDYELELANINNHLPADWEKLRISLKIRLNTTIDTNRVDDRLPHVVGKYILKICTAAVDQLNLIHGIEDRAAIHKLRIYFKRLRYLLEPFRFQMTAIQEIINFLKNIQDLLGDFRDAHISTALLTLYRDDLTNTMSNTFGETIYQKTIFEILLEHAGRQELDRFDRLRKLYVNGDFQRIITDIRIIGEELKGL